MDIPVYLFTGFLDSGKTSFIQETLEDARFNDGERTLVLLCEEGERELDPSRFSGQNVFAETIDSPEDITPSNLKAMEKKHRVKRVMVEYNGMWKLDTLYRNVPKNWVIGQEMLFADATTFELFNANMRELVVDKLQTAQLVAFNRCEKGFDKMPLHKIVRGISRQVDIAYDYGADDVEYDDIEDPLPFDKDAAVIEVGDNDYALWYRDLSEELSSYDGKTVRFKGQAVVEQVPDGCFIIGRPLMTCCADDIRFAGLVCEWPQMSGLQNRDWVLLEATVAVRRHDCYNRVGPVLTAVTVEKTAAPEKEVASFY